MPQRPMGNAPPRSQPRQEPSGKDNANALDQIAPFVEHTLA